MFLEPLDHSLVIIPQVGLEMEKEQAPLNLPSVLTVKSKNISNHVIFGLQAEN